MKETHKILLMRVLAVAAGYMCLMLAYMSTYFPPDDPTTVLVGLLREPWMEWTILGIMLFALDMFVIAKFKYYFVEK